MTPRRRTREEVLSSTVLSCTIPEAQEVLGVGRGSILNMIKDGTLHCFTVGRQRRVGVDSLRKAAGFQKS